MGTLAKVTLALATLGLFGCAPGPAFFLTKASCSGSVLAFPMQSINGIDGFTDYSSSISEETAVRMLAERRVKFIEQKVLTSVWNLPLGLIVQKVAKDSFAKIWIDEAGSSSCFTNNEHIQFGVNYDLYTQGMKPSECLAGAIVTQPTGRYRMEAHYKVLLGSSSVEYEVLDGLNGSKVASIQSSKTVESPAESKSPIPNLFQAGCFANQQTVSNLFQGSIAQENPVPSVRVIDTTRPISGTIKFIRTQMSKDEFLKINSSTAHQDITLASNWKNKRTVAVADGRFIGHFEFPNETRLLTVPAGLLFPGSNQVSFVWFTGEIQNFGVAVDEGKFISTDRYKVAGNKLLVFAVTDWTKGWAVFEASLSDFDIRVAKRVMAEVATIDESITTRFVAQDGGLVRDMQTGLVWTKADIGVETIFANAPDICSKKGPDWSLPSTAQLSGLFLATGSIRTKCGHRKCYVSPAFELSSWCLWSRDLDDAGKPLMMSLVSGSMVKNEYMSKITASTLCVRSH